MKEKVLQLSIGLTAFAPFKSLASAQCDGAKAVGVDCSPDALNTPLDSVINIIFFAAGTAAVIVIVIGGLRYILSAGDANGAKEARQSILFAIIGLVIIILARAIISFVVGRL